MNQPLEAELAVLLLQASAPLVPRRHGIAPLQQRASSRDSLERLQRSEVLEGAEIHSLVMLAQPFTHKRKIDAICTRNTDSHALTILGFRRSDGRSVPIAETLQP